MFAKTMIAWTLLGLLLLAGCGGESSECSSQCARCGRSRHSKTKNGRTTTEIKENYLSRWLSRYVSDPCQHVWIPVSGWSSKNNLAWDGVSHFNDALLCIYERRSTAGEVEIKQLLERYFAILEMTDRTEQGDELAKFCAEVKDRPSPLAGKSDVPESQAP